MNEPFLKWAGGKRWLVKKHPNLFPRFSGRYIEPFLGSAAVFFHLQPKHGILSDINGDLIETYGALRDFPHAIHGRLVALQKLHCREFYYETRDIRPTGKIDRAARFIYLNRTCWNGLYRVNLNGRFNVPIGTKDAVAFPEGVLAAISVTLQKANICECDFESTIDKAEAGDFLFVDPPYTVSHNNNGFIKYNNVLFSWDDQIRLAGAVERASGRGALVFVSNANHSELKPLYKGFTSCMSLARASVLSGKAEGRKRTSEAAFVNYSVDDARQNLH